MNRHRHRRLFAINVGPLVLRIRAKNLANAHRIARRQMAAMGLAVAPEMLSLPERASTPSPPPDATRGASA